MHWCLICVVVHKIVPVLFRRGQNLHPHCPQKGKRLSFSEVPFLWSVVRLVAERTAIGPASVVFVDEPDSMKSVMLGCFCCLRLTEMRDLVALAAGGGGGLGGL